MKTPAKKPTKRDRSITRQPLNADEWADEDQADLAFTGLHRNPWHGLTPEEAYRKGVEDGERYQREQERLRREMDDPKCRPFMISKPNVGTRGMIV